MANVRTGQSIWGSKFNDIYYINEENECVCNYRMYVAINYV
jgi:hypothetical protein